MRLVGFFFVLMFCAMPLVAQAGKPVYFRTDLSRYADPKYERMVTAVEQSGRAADFAFFELRNVYRDTSRFDAITSRVLARLESLRAAAAQSGKAADFMLYKTALRAHLGDAEVVLFARNVARNDARFGDARTLDWLFQGLSRLLIHGAGGTGPDDAVVVQTEGEESLTLRLRGLRRIKTDSIRDQGFYAYNVHTVEDMRTKARKRFYIDVTYPIAFLINREKAQTKNLDLSR